VKEFRMTLGFWHRVFGKGNSRVSEGLKGKKAINSIWDVS
jgi:hypothetical protein